MTFTFPIHIITRIKPSFIHGHEMIFSTIELYANILYSIQSFCVGQLLQKRFRAAIPVLSWLPSCLRVKNGSNIS